MKFNAAVITVSDRVSKNEAVDKTGPALIEYLESEYQVTFRKTVADEITDIQDAVIEACGKADLVVTTGGTGCGIRDVTPEAIRPLIQKETSGFTIAMMSASLQKTPLASLSRPVTGIRGNSLIITLPGSIKGALENIVSLEKVLGHSLDLIRGKKDAGEVFHKQLHGGHTCSFHGPKPSNSDVPMLTNDPKDSVSKRARVSPFPMIEYQDALTKVLEYSIPGDIELKSINDDLVGYVLAEDIFAKEAVPGYRASVVDGYAVIHLDGPGVYPVQSDSSAAGSTERLVLSTGQISRITTGAPVPDGANAVVMVEDTKLIETSADGTKELFVEILSPCRENQYIRQIGSDIAIGEKVLEKGQIISPLGGELGALAAIGVHQVRVYKRPVVSILSTGNELVEVSHPGPLPYGSIRDSNRPALKATLERLGYKVVDLGIASDNAEDLKVIIKNGLENSDVLITTGGVSMGEFDLLKPVLERYLGATIHFGRVKLKPGKPTTFATIPLQKRPKLVFALPGNPVSALVTLYLFVIPSLKGMSGCMNTTHDTIMVKLQHDIKLDYRPEFYRVVIRLVNGVWEATGTGIQMSSRITSMVSANGLLTLPPATQERQILPVGTIVPAILLQ